VQRGSLVRSRGALVTAGAAVFLVLLPAATAAAAPTPRGCQEFGLNVSGLATTLGADFGATASGVATLFPGAFPVLVVHPEQTALCG
jgi:hypothetical protein